MNAPGTVVDVGFYLPNPADSFMVASGFVQYASSAPYNTQGSTNPGVWWEAGSYRGTADTLWGNAATGGIKTKQFIAVLTPGQWFRVTMTFGTSGVTFTVREQSNSFTVPTSATITTNIPLAYTTAGTPFIGTWAYDKAKKVSKIDYFSIRKASPAR
jgi:hypothetical protein